MTYLSQSLPTKRPCVQTCPTGRTDKYHSHYGLALRRKNSDGSGHWSGFDSIELPFFILRFLSLRVVLWMLSKEKITWLVVRCQVITFLRFYLGRTPGDGGCDRHQEFFSNSSSLGTLCCEGKKKVRRNVRSWVGDDSLSFRLIQPSVAGTSVASMLVIFARLKTNIGDEVIQELRVAPKQRLSNRSRGRRR